MKIGYQGVGKETIVNEQNGKRHTGSTGANRAEREAKDETKDDERTAGIAQGKDAVCARQGVREELWSSNVETQRTAKLTVVAPIITCASRSLLPDATSKILWGIGAAPAVGFINLESFHHSNLYIAAKFSHAIAHSGRETDGALPAGFSSTGPLARYRQQGDSDISSSIDIKTDIHSFIR